MTQNKFWILCISRMPKSKKPYVKILSSSDVPKKGEALSILGQFESKVQAKWVREKFGDKKLIKNAKDGINLEYSKYYPEFEERFPYHGNWRG